LISWNGERDKWHEFLLFATPFTPFTDKATRIAEHGQHVIRKFALKVSRWISISVSSRGRKYLSGNRITAGK